MVTYLYMVLMKKKFIEKQHQGVESISFPSSFTYVETRHAVSGSETKFFIAPSKGISKNIDIFLYLLLES